MGCEGLKGDRGIKDDAIFWLGHLVGELGEIGIVNIG